MLWNASLPRMPPPSLAGSNFQQDGCYKAVHMLRGCTDHLTVAIAGTPWSTLSYRRLLKLHSRNEEHANECMLICSAPVILCLALPLLATSMLCSKWLFGVVSICPEPVSSNL
eukprot:1159437-Pelagomonas_calceolata.AAC.5